MTLQEAKDKIAQLYGHKDWRAFRSDGMDWRVYETAHEEVAERYARSKWNEACEAQKLAIEIKENLKQRITEKFNEEFIHVSDVAYLIQSAPKPEFKP